MKIIDKKILADCSGTRITQFVLSAPLIAAKALPGQFILLMANESGERLPLTIVDTDAQKGTVTIIVQELGYSTKLLGMMNQGDSLYSLAGPLGHPTEIKKYGKVIIVGGGVGIAEILPVAKALKQTGNIIYSILGSRTKELLILKDDLSKWSDKLFLTTDDGSLGEKGFVSDVLKRLLTENRDYQIVYCVGPVPMMRVVTEVTRPFAVKTIVCLNAIMLDGTGMCGGCRLIVDGKTKFCCVDGPEFDAHSVDFNDLVQRQKRFINEEKQSLEKLAGHQCQLDQQIKRLSA